MAGEMTTSWFGPTEPRKRADQSELGRLKREWQRDEDRMHEIIATQQERGARIDRLEEDEIQANWDDGSDVDDDDGLDLADVFGSDDTENEVESSAEPTAQINPMTQAALNAMSPDQRAAFTGEAA
jgi:hypothetical protein